VSFIDQTHDEVVEPGWGDAAAAGVAAAVAEGTDEDSVEELGLEEFSVDEDASTNTSIEDSEPASTHALFHGDEGGLDPDARRALVVLLKNRFITSESHPREWRALMAWRQEIGKRLNDLFLELKIDTEREVAYKRPVTSDTGGRDFPTLVHDTIWQREETALLVFLRVRARNDEVRGEVQFRVSEAEMLEYLRENRPESATNQVSDDRRADRAINALKSAGLLTKTNEDGMFRISPAIEPMLPVPVLNNLLTWLNVRTESGAATDPKTDDEPTAEEPS
jgi:hypothetical protein